MEYIKELQEQGFEEKFVVDFLLGATNERKLTLNERAYVVKYYRNLEIALAECSHEEKAALPLQNVSVSFLSEGIAIKIYKQIGLLAEKQGGITGITTLNQLPSWLQNFMKELAADYGRQIDFLKSVLANER